MTDTLDELRRRTAFASLATEDLVALVARGTWHKIKARPTQLPPEDQSAWDVWLLQAGRGFGKTISAVEWLWWEAWNDPFSFNHVVVRRKEDLAKVAFEGPSGLFRRVPDAIVLHKVASPYKLTLTNGATILGFSADDPDVLRGPEAHRTWCDELAAWRRLDAAWNDGVVMGTRLGSERNCGRPKVVITTTPRPIRLLKELVQRPTTVVSRGSTYDNRDNLPASFLDELERRYRGTRRGRQELQGELLEDVPGALWKQEWIEATRVWVRPADLVQVIVAVDPPASSEEGSNECGLVAVASDRAGRGYVLADRSDVASPEAWAEAAVLLHDEVKADHVTVEVNQGGEMCRAVLAAAAQRLFQAQRRRSPELIVRMVHASRGKELRAEPVSQLYEQRRVSHVGEFQQLEDQLTSFTKGYNRARDGSPDRLDALVWGLTDLLVEPEADLAGFSAGPAGLNAWAPARPTSAPIRLSFGG